MTFDEWFHKEYEPADLQIKQYAENKEGLHIPATVYLEDLKKAFEAGLHTDVHTDNSKVIAELKAQIEKMRQCGNCGNGTIGNCEYCKRKPNQTCTDTSDYWRLKEIKEK